MKTFHRFVLTATVAAASAGAFAQQPVPPPPLAPQPVAPAPPPRPQPPLPPPSPTEPRTERRREVPPPPPLTRRERGQAGDRLAEDWVERRAPQTEQRDAYHGDNQLHPVPVERERRTERSFGFPSLPERPLKPTPYLGVATATVPPVLAAQLGLREGFGLVVNEVLPDSPAAAAGIQKHDVLKLLNDQQLVDPNQFATLIRGMGKDNEVSVTLLRHGQEQKVTIKIGERMLPERRAEGSDPQFPSNVPGFKSRWELQSPNRFGELPTVRAYPWETQPFPQKMREYREEMQRFQQRLRDWQKNPKTDPPAPPPVPVLDSPSAGQPVGPDDLLREVRRGGGRELRIVQPDGTTTFHTNQARLVMKDTDGEIEMTGENGRRVISIRDAAGKSIFNGPLDTTEQRRAVPEPFRGKIEKMIITTAPGESSARIEAEASASSGTSTDSDVQ